MKKKKSLRIKPKKRVQIELTLFQFLIDHFVVLITTSLDMISDL